MGILISNAWIILDGSSFSPDYLSKQTNLSFDEVVEKGVTVMAKGRHKGSSAPSGWAQLDAIPLAESETIVDRLLSLLVELRDKIGNRFTDFNLESISVWLLVKHNGEGQYGFEIGPDVLLLIGQLGATLCIDYML